MRAVLLLLGLAVGALVRAQTTPAPDSPRSSPAFAHERWAASWVTHPDAPRHEFGVWLFRKSFQLGAVPSHFLVNVSADTRYRLWVNGTSVSFGPQRSDTWVWRYDTVDIARFLQAGANVIAAQVWSYGDDAPYATVGVRTGLIVQGDTDAERVVDTGPGWTATRDPAYTPLPSPELHTYLVVGPGFRFDAAKHPWGWEVAAFDDQGWSPVRVLGRGSPHAWGTDMDHPLAPRNIPPPEESPTRFAGVRRASGGGVPDGFVAGTAPWHVPPHTHASLLLDQGYETSAFPVLATSGGCGAHVTLTYAEGLFDAKGQKGNRNEIEGRSIAGISDEFVLDGAARRRFTVPNFRTYRYVGVDVQTADEALSLDDLAGVFTAYPFRQQGEFTSDDPSLARIWEVGWRTARLCAFETYVDCPYYEQLQYVGDTRIQALVSLYVAGDDRLMRNAIELFDRSRIADGLTQSRYPSAVPQVINTFSLFWIDMVHDYWMHRPDTAFVQARLPGVEAVLGWFERRIDERTGLLGPLTYWTFGDWTTQWAWDETTGSGGEPPGARSGGSAFVSLQLAGTLQRAARLEQAFGRDEVAARYAREAAALAAAVRRTCWDERRHLFADTPQKTEFSQHTNALAVLAGASSGAEATELIHRVVHDTTLVQCSTYFRFYLLRAMKTAGLGDAYLSELGPWRTMLDRGLTTFAEQPDPTRSDCHAWSASPIYELLATVCGVEPASPGFASVRIAPHLGALRHAAGVVPHPSGTIRVEYTVEGAGLRAHLTLPPQVSGEFVWHDQHLPLHPGEQVLELK